jgi:hypothetical protein
MVCGRGFVGTRREEKRSGVKKGAGRCVSQGMGCGTD